VGLETDMPRPTLALSLAAALAFAGAATASTHGSASVQRLHRGELAQITAGVPSGASCLASLVFGTANEVDSAVKQTSNGRLSWSVRVPATAPLGPAQWIIRCGVTWSITRPVLIVAAQAPKPRVVVGARGFSQRAGEGGRREVSYGVFLRNTSATQDAVNVYVLLDFVGSNGRLLAARTENVGLVAAGQRFALGDATTLPGSPPVARLEITAEVRSQRPHAARPLPSVAAVQLLPDDVDQTRLAGVTGELVNPPSQLGLRSARLSVVVTDASGTILGGGRGAVAIPVPAGARVPFQASGGFGAVPMARAAAAVVSVDPAYE
jgi:hypothetical protein